MPALRKMGFAAPNAGIKRLRRGAKTRQCAPQARMICFAPTPVVYYTCMTLLVGGLHGREDHPPGPARGDAARGRRATHRHDAVASSPGRAGHTPRAVARPGRPICGL